MIFEPFDWNVVVAGAWNRAILTPQWIMRYVFRVEENTPLPIEIPVNTLGPFRIRHGGVRAIPGDGRLELSTDPCNDENLELAKGYACIAMEELPRTPLSAAGVNIRYRNPETPPELYHLLDSQVDHSLSDAGFVIGGRKLNRSVTYKEGLINFELNWHQSEGVAIIFNFHLSSSDVEKLKSWLQVPIADLREKAQIIINALPGVSV